MSDKTPERLAIDLVFDWEENDKPALCSAKARQKLERRVAAAIAQERAKQQAVVWPSDEIIDKNRLSVCGTDKELKAFSKAVGFLKSQIKPVELPSDEEVDSYCEEKNMGPTEGYAVFYMFWPWLKSRIEAK